MDEDDQVIVYYTLYSEIELSNITVTASELANKACSHAVITINTIIDVFPTNTDLFTYNTTSHYTSTKFMGIMIDTKAFKYFTAGYSQFFTL